MPMKEYFLMSLSAAATQYLNSPMIKRVQAPFNGIELYHITPPLIAQPISGLIYMHAKVGFCPLESWQAPCGLIPLVPEH